MTIVVGQIEPLKKLKEILNSNGITRFNSIGSINNFIKNYDSERNEIPSVVENALDEEIKELQSALINRQQIYDDLRGDIINETNNKIKKLAEASKQAIENSNKSLFGKIFNYLKIKRLRNKISCLEKNSEKTLNKKTHAAEQEVIKTKNRLDYYAEYKKNIISERCDISYKEIDSTKEVIDGLYTQIAGAIGENTVVNELQKLSDDYYLINDFTIEFNPPIYNKKTHDRIFSIQIDHLLISQSGVFLLETKNWSKQSLKNLDLRSPVEQILRTSYALFVLLNSESTFNNISLARHHWGSKKIPIRNIIVMINEKPKEEFKHVKVLSLKELNRYIKYFDQIFNQDEVESIFDYLNVSDYMSDNL
ncbi:MAG: nuclease-related domain-containing protein [Candidatus Thiodiazotropha sp.]